MHGRALLVLLFVLCAGVLAQEGDPWGGTPPYLLHKMEGLADAEAQGQVGPAEREELRMFWATHLRRCTLDAVESAHYSIAELQLELGKPQEAISELNKVLAGKPSEEVSNLTHLNLAEIYRLNLHDPAKAAEQYRQVGGPLRPRAQRCLVTMLEEKRDPAEAAKLLEQQIADAKEKGEKLALLHRLAALYKRAQRPEQALATYQRITREFSEDDVKQMRDAAAGQAEAVFARIKALHEQGRGPEAQGLPEQLGARAQELRLAGRWDEARALMQAMQKGFPELQEFMERQERARRQGPGGEPPEGRKPGQF